MMDKAKIERWPLEVEILRHKPSRGQYVETFSVELDPESTVLDVLEEIQINQDQTLVYRHSCHHASCGTCGMKINGEERLGCLSKVGEVARPTGSGYGLRLEPLGNLEVKSDLVVDPSPLFATMEQAGAPYHRYEQVADHTIEAFPDCIECSICLSACPVVASHTGYVGPAPLAGSLQTLLQAETPEAAADALAFADQEHGAWRCHMAFECTAACPMNVRPAEAIMNLRREITVSHLGFGTRTRSNRPAAKLPAQSGQPVGKEG